MKQYDQRYITRETLEDIFHFATKYMPTESQEKIVRYILRPSDRYGRAAVDIWDALDRFNSYLCQFGRIDDVDASHVRVVLRDFEDSEAVFSGNRKFELMKPIIEKSISEQTPDDVMSGNYEYCVMYAECEGKYYIKGKFTLGDLKALVDSHE